MHGWQPGIGSRYTMLRVKGFGRSLSLALVALLLVLVAGPVAAARCKMRGACPMMAQGVQSAPCHSAEVAGEMSAPMDCCRPQAIQAPTGTPNGLEPLPAAVLSTASGIAREIARAEPAAFSRAGQLHPLGLFTLHSVWRI